MAMQEVFFFMPNSLAIRTEKLLYTVAINELLRMKNAVTQIAMDYS